MTADADATHPSSPLELGVDAPRNFAKSASRALDVLCYIASRQAPVRAREIAHELNVSPSSTDQLLKTMVSSGYLVFRLVDKTYFPAPKLGQFARWMMQLYPDSALVEDLLAELNQATGQVALFSVECGYFMEVQNYVLGDKNAVQGRQIALWPGRRVPILETAIGAAVLAGRSDSEIRRLFERARRIRPVSDSAMAERIASIMYSVPEFRRRGYAWRTGVRGEPRTTPPAGVMSIAVRLRSTGLGSGLVLGFQASSAIWKSSATNWRKPCANLPPTTAWPPRARSLQAESA